MLNTRMYQHAIAPFDAPKKTSTPLLALRVYNYCSSKSTSAESPASAAAAVSRRPGSSGLAAAVTFPVAAAVAAVLAPPPASVRGKEITVAVVPVCLVEGGA